MLKNDNKIGSKCSLIKYDKCKVIFSIIFLIYIISVLYITLFNREPTIRR